MDILRPYLACPEFTAFWTDLGLTEADLRSLLPGNSTSNQ
jgi:hypothetical protein